MGIIFSLSTYGQLFISISIPPFQGLNPAQGSLQTRLKYSLKNKNQAIKTKPEKGCIKDLLREDKKPT